MSFDVVSKSAPASYLKIGGGRSCSIKGGNKRIMKGGRSCSIKGGNKRTMKGGRSCTMKGGRSCTMKGGSRKGKKSSKRRRSLKKTKKQRGGSSYTGGYEDEISKFSSKITGGQFTHGEPVQPTPQ